MHGAGSSVSWPYPVMMSDCVTCRILVRVVVVVVRHLFCIAASTSQSSDGSHTFLSRSNNWRLKEHSTIDSSFNFI